MSVRAAFVWGSWALLTATGVGAAGNMPPLVAAVKSANRAVVLELLKQRVDVDSPEADGTTALHWAVRMNDVDLSERLLRAGANAKTANRYNVTPLALAAINGNAVIIELLLQAGVDPNTEQAQGETVLMTAARTGLPDAVQVLLAHGAKVQAKERTLGETALMWAAADNHAAVVQLLIAAGAETNGRSSVVDPTPIPSRPGGGFVSVTLPRGGWTPLMYAARQGAVDAARILANAGADLDVSDRDGMTPLLLAITNAHFDLAAMLLEKGAAPNVVDSRDTSPLYAAVDMHTAPWTFGRPPSRTADTTSSVDIAAALLKRGANPNLQLKGAILKRFRTAGDASLGEGSTPFMRAAKSGDVTMMHLLLQNGANPFLTQKNHTTALMLAAGLGFRNGVSGTNLDDSALDSGTEEQALEAIRLCLDLGLDIDAFNGDGQTAVHGAVHRSDVILKFLAEHGAKLDTKDRQGRTPLEWAVRGTTAGLLRELMNKVVTQNPLQRH